MKNRKEKIHADDSSTDHEYLLTGYTVPTDFVRE